ncbi:cell cycle checkpoint protein rad17: PROVISIONAL [Gigaspora margarita]|uniref:Cell cycle checkpoint protein rad17: PROVISIONAL n=1 Tax=Gigaspora margarita TaxID=4874 RepID=A0A8H3X2K9_GIGMA|nr:cell cycle checkpoint protein rad17: PROVISIONAL [Gigaspora margarita]
MNAVAKKVLPNSKPSTNHNDQLYNDVLELLYSKHIGWKHGIQNSISILFINKLVSLLYYLDDKHKTLKLHSLNILLKVYFPIAEQIRVANEYEIISVKEFLFETKEKRFHYLSNFAIDSTIMLHHYQHRNYLETLNFIWKNSQNFELQDETKNAQAIMQTQSMLPKFFTWYIRRNIFAKYTCLIFADNKYKIPIELLAADYDFTKLSITLSVSLFAKIPDNPIQSFYTRQVYISLKDTTFQASSALKHAMECYNSIGQYYLSTNSLPEIVIIYTSGGPDHRCNFGSVQVLLIALFLTGDFDLVIVACIAPYHSCANPVEQLKLHNDYLEINNLASEEEIDKFFEIIAQIDSKLDKSITTMNQLQKRKLYQTLLKAIAMLELYVSDIINI